MPLAADARRRAKEGGSNQKLKLLRRGNAMSGAPIMSGTNQLPKPPMSAGIRTKKIITRPCAETKTLKSCESSKYCSPGAASSTRIATERRSEEHKSELQSLMGNTYAVL